MKYRVELHIKSEAEQWYREHELEDTQSLTLGRKPSDIEVPQDSLSRKHCFISVQDGGLLIQDNKSKNGLFKGDSLVSELLLLPGDSVRAGECEITLRGLAPIESVVEEVEIDNNLKNGHKDPSKESNALLNVPSELSHKQAEPIEASQVIEMPLNEQNNKKESKPKEDSKSYVIESFQKQQEAAIPAKTEEKIVEKVAEKKSEKTKTGYKIREKYENKKAENKVHKEVSMLTSIKQDQAQAQEHSIRLEQNDSAVIQSLPEFQSHTKTYRVEQNHESQKIAVGQSLVSSATTSKHSTQVTQGSRRVQFSVIKNINEIVPFYYNLEHMGLNPFNYLRLYPLMMLKPGNFFRNVDLNGSYELSFFLIVFSTIVSSSILFVGSGSKYLFWPIFMLLAPFTISNLFFRIRSTLGLGCKQHHLTRIFSYWVYFLTPFSVVARFEAKWILVPLILSFVWLAYGFEQSLKVKMSSVFPLIFGIGMSLFALTYFLIP